jgi:hypothetical protein
MKDEHETMQEALAGFALNALDDEDRTRIEELLAVHLPGCPECRAALEAFEYVAGELGLAPGPRTAPEPPSRLHREGIISSRERRRGWAPTVAAAAAVAVVCSLAAWSAILSTRVSAAEDRQAKTSGLLATVSHPQSQVVPLASQDIVARPIQLAATFVPGGSTLYLFGSMPSPGRDSVYQVWLVRSGRFHSAGTFVPDDGEVLVRVQANAATYDGLLITEEPRHGSGAPSQRHVVTAAF